MARESFVVKNNSVGDIELKDFGIILPSNETVDLDNYDKASTSDEIYSYLSGGTLVRLIGGQEVTFDNAFDTVSEPYQLSSIESSQTSLSVYDSMGGISIPDVWTDIQFPDQKVLSGFTYINSVEMQADFSEWYIIFAKVTTEMIPAGVKPSESAMRILKDTGGGYVEINGSRAYIVNYDVDRGEGTMVSVIVEQLNQGDKIKVQAIRDGGTSAIQTVAHGSSFNVFSAKGRDGKNGLPGAGSNVVLQNSGVTVDNTPHGILNFIGNDVTLEDQGNGKANIIFNFVDILSSLQLRRSTSYSLTTSWSDITFDIQDIENTPDIIEHNRTTTDRVDIKSDGLYLISYSADVVDKAQAKIRINDTTDINGSLKSVGYDNATTNDRFGLSNQFIEILNAGDFISMQGITSNAGNILYNLNFVIVKLDGIKGEKGEKGEKGVDGSGATIVVEEDSVEVPNTPHSTLNFTGNGVSVSDDGNSGATINIQQQTLPVFGTEFQRIESLGLSSTSSLSYINKATLTTSNLPSGTYKIEVTYGYQSSSTSDPMYNRVQLNSVTLGQEHIIVASNTTNKRYTNRVFYQNISGVNTITLDYRSTKSNRSMSIFDAVISLFRIS